MRKAPPVTPKLHNLTNHVTTRLNFNSSQGLSPEVLKTILFKGSIPSYDFIRHVRAGPRPPREFNAVAEYNPPYGFATNCQAELFWNSEEPWEEIARRARMRARPER